MPNSFFPLHDRRSGTQIKVQAVEPLKGMKHVFVVRRGAEEVFFSAASQEVRYTARRWCSIAVINAHVTGNNLFISKRRPQPPLPPSPQSPPLSISLSECACVLAHDPNRVAFDCLRLLRRNARSGWCASAILFRAMKARRKSPSAPHSCSKVVAATR